MKASHADKLMNIPPHSFSNGLSTNPLCKPSSDLLPSALARGSEWGIYFSLYTYVRTYVRTYQNMSRSGMLIGMLRVSCRPIEFYLLRGLDGARTTTFKNRSVDERAVLQGLQSWSSYIWESNSQRSQHLFIPQLHNSLA